MFTLFNSIVVSTFLLSFLSHRYFSYVGRFTALKVIIIKAIINVIESKVGKRLLFFLFVMFLVINIIGNIPLNRIPTMYYSLTFTIRLLFWVPLILCISKTQLIAFIAHIVPYGCPTGIIFFLPLVEIVSQLIRPITLIVRLRTNLSAGHIMIYMFSYFTLLSSALSPFIYVVLYLLFFLELAISILQAYIFVSLLSLYINETV